MVAKGFSNQEVAAKLGTTRQYIKNCLIEIFALLGFSNRLELAIYMVKEVTLAELRSTKILPKAPKPKKERLSYLAVNTRNKS